MHNSSSEQRIPTPKIYNLKQNSSLILTTSSSIKGKKIKLLNDFSPFNNKKFSDLPICISLFSNNISINENDINININQKPKLNLKFSNINPIKRDKNKFNKKIISRNQNSFLLNLNNKNSNLISNYSLFKKLPISEIKNDSKPIINKLNTPLFKFTQQNFLTKHKNNNTNNITSLSSEQDLSIIKTPKNSLNSIKNNKKKFRIFLSSNTSDSFDQKNISKLIARNSKSKIFNNCQNLYKLYSNQNSSKNLELNELINGNENKRNDKLIISDKNSSKIQINNNDIINQKKEEADITNNINKKEIGIEKTTLNKIKKNHSDKEIINKNEKNENILEKGNQQEENKENKKQKEIINKNEKNEKILEKENQQKEIKENEKQNEKIIIKQKLKIFETLQKSIPKKDNNIKIEKKKKVKNTLLNEKYDLDEIKKNKFSIELFNKKINDKNQKNKFIHKINLKSINNATNMKLFIEKSEILIKFKEKKDAIINHSKREISFEIKEDKKFYSKDDFKISNNNFKIYNHNNPFSNLGLKIIEQNKYILSNCNLEFPLKKYISNIDFDSITTALNQKNILLKFNSKDNFLIRKSKCKQNLNLKLFNLININEIILKSLPFYKDNQNLKVNKKAKNKIISSKPKFQKKVSKNLKFKTKNSKILLNAFNKNNSNKSDKKVKELINKSSKLIQEFLKNIKNPKLKKRNDSSINNFSILHARHFFKNELKINKNKDNIINEVEEPDNINDVDMIYLELIKRLLSGENKSFINYFEKNKEYIDINQELFDGNSLLILATREGNLNIAKYLCEHGSEVNNQNYIGNTALHYAIGNNFFDIADLLVRYGARESIKNKKNLSVWQCMEQNMKY